MERPLPVFDVLGPAYEMALHWKKWKRAFEYYTEGEGLEKPTRLRSKLLHLAGIRLQDIFQTLPEPPTNDSSNPYETAVAMLDKYFSFKPNITFERHAFRKLVQAEGETVSQFVTRLREQAELCQFKDAEEQIRDQLVERIDSDKLRRKLLDVDKLDLAKALLDSMRQQRQVPEAWQHQLQLELSKRPHRHLCVESSNRSALRRGPANRRSKRIAARDVDDGATTQRRRRRAQHGPKSVANAGKRGTPRS